MNLSKHITYNNVINFFDNKAQTWDNNNTKAIAGLKKILSVFQENLYNKNILDIGCGTGILENELINIPFKTITAIDISEKMIHIAKQKFIDYKNINFVCENIFNINSMNKYDVAIMYNVYPHLQERKVLVRKIYNLLENNGIFIIGHGSSKENINNHHEAFAANVSNELKSAVEESKIWKELFCIDKIIDDNNLYYFSGYKK